MTLLRLRGVTVHLAGQPTPTLAGIDLDLARGEVVGIVGESGAGKTLLLRTICDALPVSARVGGVCQMSGGHVASVLQAPLAGLSPLRRIGAQIADAAACKAQAPAMLLDRMGLPPGTDRCFPQDLSGGMQMRAALARALATGAALILADEPTAALDGPTARVVLDALGRIRAAGRTVLMVTHDPAPAAVICDRIGVLHAGRIVEIAATCQVLDQPNHPYSRKLMAALPFRTKGMPRQQAATAAGCPVPLAPALELRNASHRHPGGAGVAKINLTMFKGETVAICGPSGSGKTTLARLIARLVTLHEGQIRLGDAEIGAITPRRFSQHPRRGEIQMVFQDAAASFRPWCPIRSAFGTASPARVAAVWQSVGLDPALLLRLPREVSQGQIARAALARAIVLRPQILVLDEPTSALDAMTQADMLHHLAKLTGDGMALLLVTHDLHVARLLAQRIAVLDAGRLVELGPTRQILSAPVHPTTRALVAAMP